MANNAASSNSQSVITPDQAILKSAPSAPADVCDIEAMEQAQKGPEVIIERPALGQHAEVTLQPGNNYIMNFEQADTKSFILVGDALTITFTCGGTLVLKGYGTATNGDDASTLAFAEKIEIDQLAGLIQTIEPAAGTEEAVAEAAEEVREEATGETKAEEIVKVEPAAGDEPSAEQVAQIEPAAGDDAGGAGDAGGYGFNSSFSAGNVPGLSAVGALGATQLAYNANFREYQGDPDPELSSPPVDSNPIVAGPDEVTVDETNLDGGPQTISGVVTANFGADGPGTIEFDGSYTFTGAQGGALTSGGQPITINFDGATNSFTGVDANGDVIFTLTMDPATGAFTFTLLGPIDHADGTNPNDFIRFTFGVTVTDADGDTVQTQVIVNVADDGPSVEAGTGTVDETDMNGGSATVSGTLNVDFGSDGPGSVAPDGNFTTTSLSSEGEPITISMTADGYVGVSASGDVIFTLTINADGTYTFTLHGPLDHPDGTDPNDTLTLSFGVVVTDYDGDPVSTTITIAINDDGPAVQPGAELTIDETGMNGSGTVSGLLGVDFGEDGPGSVEPNGSFSSETLENQGIELSSNGSPVTVSATADGYVGVDADGNVIFELTVNADGTYTFTLHAPLDHPDGSNPNDTIDLTFGIIVTDGDGDSVQTTITINVNDDGPVAAGGTGSVDETDMNGSNVSVSGNIGADFGADGPGTIEANGTTNTNGLTSGGQPVTVSATADGYIGVSANGDVIFTLTINADGTYTFTLMGTLDHPDGTNPNDTLTLSFGVTVTDGDGDSIQTTITIAVNDDGPVAQNDGAFVADPSVAVTGNVTSNDDLGEDGAANGDSPVTEVQFNGVPHTVPADGTITINGQYGVLTIGADGSYSYQAYDGVEGTDTFTYTITDGDGDTSTANLTFTVDCDDVPIVTNEKIAIDETFLGPITVEGEIDVNFGNDDPGTVDPSGTFSADGSLQGGQLTSEGQPITVGLVGDTYFGIRADGTVVFQLTINDDGTYTFEAFENIDHGDSSNPDDTIELHFGFTATDADGDSTNGTLTVNWDDDGPTACDDYASVDPGCGCGGGGSVNGNVVTNDDVGNDNTDTPVTAVQFNGATYSVPAGGSVVIIGQYGVLTMNSNGEYTYEAHQGTQGGQDIFTYTLTDGDGDTSNANLTIDVAADDIPVVAPETLSVDETFLGPITVNGSVDVNYGNDGPGETNPNGSFAAGGSLEGGQLTSDGQAITVSLSGDTYYGIRADGTVVFQLTLNEDGTYQFQAFENLDHGNINNHDETITLNFGFNATDCDGDTTCSTITVNWDDDGPVACDDVATVDPGCGCGGGGVINGNVVTNDDVGSDENSHPVTSVEFNGQTYTIPVGGSVTINGQYGVLVMHSNGQYTYDAGNNGDGQDVFTYTLTDGDGDTSTANLTVNVMGDDVPLITPETLSVDETFLGPITVQGEVDVDFGDDGPGEVNPNGAFSAGGSLENGQLTSDGQPITVSLNGDSYYGVRADGTVVFKLTVNEDGTYTFKAYDNLDHGNINNHDEAITLTFGINATDCDGDTSCSTITVNWDDDGPVACPDVATVDPGCGCGGGGGSVNGNVVANDDVGNDTNSQPVTSVEFNGQTYSVPAGGSVTINGQYGTLVMNSNGQYVYTAGNNGDGQDVFTYTLTDGDGDTDTSTLTLNVFGDDVPQITPEVISMDETFLGPVTINGSVDVDFGDDGPGEVDPNGGFSAGGSLENGQLTSDGQAITVTLNGDSYFGVRADGTLVFKLTVNENGTYTFKAYENLDHADTSDPDDTITLTFGINATDCDGDVSCSTITVNWDDDGPVACDDVVNVSAPCGCGGGQAAGNVVSNDDVGADNNSHPVTSVSYNGQSYAVPQGGSVQIIGEYGMLVIHSNGEYTYTADNNGDGQDVFTYTLTDGDGDSAVASLTFNVDGDGPGLLLGGGDDGNSGSDDGVIALAVVGHEVAIDDVSVATDEAAVLRVDAQKAAFEKLAHDGVLSNFNGDAKRLQAESNTTTLAAVLMATAVTDVIEAQATDVNSDDLAVASSATDDVVMASTDGVAVLGATDDIVTFTRAVNDDVTDVQVLSVRPGASAEVLNAATDDLSVASLSASNDEANAKEKAAYENSVRNTATDDLPVALSDDASAPVSEDVVKEVAVVKAAVTDEVTLAVATDDVKAAEAEVTDVLYTDVLHNAEFGVLAALENFNPASETANAYVRDVLMKQSFTDEKAFAKFAEFFTDVKTHALTDEVVRPFKVAAHDGEFSISLFSNTDDVLSLSDDVAGVRPQVLMAANDDDGFAGIMLTDVLDVADDLPVAHDALQASIDDFVIRTAQNDVLTAVANDTAHTDVASFAAFEASANTDLENILHKLSQSIAA